MISSKKGFTLVELLVVIGMIAVITGALTVSVQSARERARIQKATTEVKVIAQAILGYENWDQGSGRFELPTMTKATADKGNLGFLLGQGANAQSGGKIPVLLMAALEGGGQMKDPWGTPYRVTIRESSTQLERRILKSSLKTGFFLPNFYRSVREGE
jgi:prepilin-type N-terminal cleavage/methylation domain-containing protein